MSFSVRGGLLPGVAAGLLAVALSLPALAQIDEVIVTTRKREESLQEVPIAITAISSEQIERQGITDLGDVARLSPSLQFDTAYGPQDVRITVRGLSNTRGRSNVAFLVDGIDVTTENLIAAGSGLLANRRLLNDVEQIEVVKGPQSALFGRAAFAGAISYTTKEPGDEFEGKVGANLADYGRREFSGAFGGPIGDTFGLRLTGVEWSQDGFYQNSVSGEDVGSGEGYGTSLAAVWRPMDTMKWKARVAFSEEEYAPQASVRIDGDTLMPFPQQAIDAGIGNPSLPLFTRIYDFGNAFPLPKSYGSASGKVVSLSENPVTGEDYPGDDVRVLQTSLIGTWDVGLVSLSSYTGYTEGEFSQYFDQDYQARGRPDTILAQQETNTDQTTRQFSQELRLVTNLDGPVQYTLGALYWEEERDLYDNNYIVACLPVQVLNFNTRELGYAPGICDGTGGTVSSWQQYARTLRPNADTIAAHPEVANYPGDHWIADTEHWSYYAMVEAELTDSLKLTLEDRLVVEEFDLQKPNQSGCTALGFILAPLLDEAANPGFDALCTSVYTIVNGYDPSAPNDSQTWAYIKGTSSSRFHTPKVTLHWSIDDQRLVYFSWGFAQKPGGINQLSPGGPPGVRLEDEYFDPEKMDAWELGLKSSWEAAGPLIVNGSIFLQDYSDKQVTTQVVLNGQLAPRVVNAAAAQVWGVELESQWQPAAVEGLLLSLSYTWLDAKYVDFLQDTKAMARVAANNQCEIVEKVTTEGVELFCRIDFSGNQLERTPEHAVVGAASFRRPFLDTRYDWLLEGNASWQDERFVDDDNFTTFDSYWMVDARLGLTSDSTEIILYVDNLLDDDTLKSGGSGPDFGEQVTQLGFTAGLGVTQYFGTLPDPRVFGIRFNYRFGAQ